MTSSQLKVFIPSKGPVTLRPTDHLATGGEGAVYVKGGVVFKLFLDPQKAQITGMGEKIALLAQMKHPYIVSPQDVLLDAQHNVVGYYMPEAAGIPLMKTFTNTWRAENAFSGAQAIQLVEHMREAVLAAHGYGAVMVDGNETNYLAHGVTPRIIDVDSWQIGAHKATAIMPSVRDYHAKSFDAHSDWFSWGVVSFQVLTGIHPYKGTHPEFKKGDLEARMRANASVFDPRVKLNAAVRDFSCCPAPLLDWYERVFQQGERSAPPRVIPQVSPRGTVKKTRIAVTSHGAVRQDRVLGLPGTIRHVSANGVAFYGEGLLLKAHDLQRNQALLSLSPSDIEALFANSAVLVRHADSFLYVWASPTGVQGKKIAGERDPQPASAYVHTNVLPLSVSRLMLMGPRLFALNPQADNGLVELELADMGPKVALTVKSAWPVNVRSTQFFDGCAVMDCLGAPFIVVPSSNALHVYKAPGLKGFKLINGFSRNDARVWLHGVSKADGQIYRVDLTSNGAEFSVTSAQVVDEALLNIAVNSKGIAVGLMEDGMVTVLNTGNGSLKQVPDSGVFVTMHLFSMPDGIYFYKEQDVFKISLS